MYIPAKTLRTDKCALYLQYMHHGMFTFVCLVYTMYTTMLSVFFLFYSEELSRKKVQNLPTLAYSLLETLLTH